MYYYQVIFKRKMAHFCINGFKFIELPLFSDNDRYYPLVVDMRNYSHLNSALARSG